MKYISFLSIIFLFASCQKEVEPEVRDEPITSEPQLLIDRIVTVESPVDSMTTRYHYDANDRLTRIVVTHSDPDFNSTDDRAVRNTQGLITQIIRKSAYDIRAGIDSLVFDVVLNPATQRYQYMKANPLSHGYTMDSLSFGYDAIGRINQLEIFMTDGISGYKPVDKTLFTYDAVGNTVKSESYHAYVSPTYEWNRTLSYTYDLTKKGPYNFGNEGIIFADEDPARNMPSTMTWQDRSPIVNDVVTYSKTTYNNSGYPVLTVVSFQSGTPDRTVKFYYR